MVAELTLDPALPPPDGAGHSLALTEHAPWPMAMVAGGSHIVCSVNAAFCRLMDQPVEQLVGKPFYELLPPKDEAGRLLDRVFQSGISETYTEGEYPDLHPVFWSYTVWPVWEQQRLAGLMILVTEAAQVREKTLAMNAALLRGSVRQHELTAAAEHLNARLQVEISARQEATRELSEKARLLDLTIDAIIVRDMEGHILYWNHAAEALYGWPREAVLGKISHELLQTEFSIPVEQMREELNRTNHWSGELVHTTRDGRRITVLVRKSLDRDRHGNAATVLEYLTDITKRKQMEEALREAQTWLANHAGQLEGLVARRTAELTATNQQLEAFVYSIAHDLRAPLRAMQGFSELLVTEANAALGAKGRDYAGHICQAAQFMDALLRDLLAFSRISQQQVELTAVNLATVVGSVLARLQTDIEEKHARVESAGPWPRVQAHEPTLNQVLFNLVSNALKFVTPGVPPVVRLRAETQGGLIRVWVEDNGPGIAPEYQAQIFRIFTRLDGEKYAGTGIGLAIVQKGIERMGGRVGVESAAGQGSRFWFELRPLPPDL